MPLAAIVEKPHHNIILKSEGLRREVNDLRSTFHYSPASTAMIEEVNLAFNKIQEILRKLVYRKN